MGGALGASAPLLKRFKEFNERLQIIEYGSHGHWVYSIDKIC